MLMHSQIIIFSMYHQNVTLYKETDAKRNPREEKSMRMHIITFTHKTFDLKWQLQLSNSLLLTILFHTNELYM